MSLLTNIYHNNKEVLVKTINRFTLTTCILTVITSVLYFVLEMYQLALFTAIIGVLYFAVFILNKKSFHSLMQLGQLRICPKHLILEQHSFYL